MAFPFTLKAEGLAVIYIARTDVPQFVERVEGMKPADVRKAERIVADHTQFLLDEFRKIHGDID